MTDAAISRPSAVPYAAAIYLAIVQFLFTIGWGSWFYSGAIR